MFTKIRGTRDFLDMIKRDHIIEKIKDYLSRNSYNHIQLPTIEYAGLFQKSLGEGSDVISKEMFLVSSLLHGAEKEEQAVNKKIMCLRPEATAQIMRAYLENGIQVKPWKVFTEGSFFRYERPQKGRYREFSQLSIEIINAKSYMYDCQLIADLSELFNMIGLINKYELSINYIGTMQERIAYNNVLWEYIERNIKDKISCDVYEQYKKSPIKLFDTKDLVVQQYLKGAPSLSDYLGVESLNIWNNIQLQLNNLNVKYYKDDYLVRGLDYYNGVVFEFKGLSVDLGAQNVFCGGGRYDVLSLLLGGKQAVPSIGAGIGVDRVLIALEDVNVSMRHSKKIYIVFESEKEYEYGLQIAKILKNIDCVVDLDFDGLGFARGLKNAHSHNVDCAFLIGSNERLANNVVVKDMKSGKQDVVRVDELKDILL